MGCDEKRNRTMQSPISASSPSAFTSCLDPLWAHVVVIAHGSIGLGAKPRTQKRNHLGDVTAPNIVVNA